MFSKVISRATFAVAAFFAVGASHATPISFNWSMTADVNNSTLGIKKGTQISGVLTYDADTLSSGATNNFFGGSSKDWTGSLMSSTINFDTYKFNVVGQATSKNGSYSGNVGLGASVTDYWALVADEVSFTGSNSKFNSFELEFRGEVDTLNLASIDLTSFGIKSLKLNGYNIGDVGSFALVPPTPANPVPEPASLALFGLGLAGVAAMRRRKQ